MIQKSEGGLVLQHPEALTPGHHGCVTPEDQYIFVEKSSQSSQMAGVGQSAYGTATPISNPPTTTSTPARHPDTSSIQRDDNSKEHGSNKNLPALPQAAEFPEGPLSADSQHISQPSTTTPIAAGSIHADSSVPGDRNSKEFSSKSGAPTAAAAPVTRRKTETNLASQFSGSEHFFEILVMLFGKFRDSSFWWQRPAAPRSPELPFKSPESDRPQKESFPNIIIFGETGAGKSSLINMLLGMNYAATASTAMGCTFSNHGYNVELDGKCYSIWDTPGLNETERGTVSGTIALKELYRLLEELGKTTGGVHLLMYCVAGSGFRDILRVNCDLVSGIMCGGEVPLVIVVTKQENAEKTDQWWEEHKDKFAHNKLIPRHASVTTVMGKNDCFKTEYERSAVAVRKLIAETCFRAGKGFRAKEPVSRKPELKDLPVLEKYLKRYKGNKNTERQLFQQLFKPQEEPVQPKVNV